MFRSRTGKLRRLILAVTPFLIASSALASPGSTSGTIHIAIRTDGQSGQGTAADPFDGSTQEKFDATMRRCGPGSDILLGPGIFFTKGNDDGHATDGFFLQPHTRLRGSGKGITEIKLSALNFAENIQVAICTGKYGAKGPGRLVDFDYVTVEDLTVDCNSSSLQLSAPNNNIATYGVQLSGNGATVRNVEVINAYAQSGPFESFAIGIFALTRDIDGALIENCSVRKSVGNYVTAIMLGGNPGLTASGVVTQNLVTDTDWVAYSGGSTTRSVFSENIAHRVGYGFRFDTGEFTDVTFIANSWSARKSAILLTPQVAMASVSDIVISGNILRADEGPVIELTSLNETRVRGVAVQGNILRSSSPTAEAISIPSSSTPFYSDVAVTGNQTNLSMNLPRPTVAASSTPETAESEHRTKKPTEVLRATSDSSIQGSVLAPDRSPL